MAHITFIWEIYLWFKNLISNSCTKRGNILQLSRAKCVEIFFPGSAIENVTNDSTYQST